MIEDLRDQFLNVELETVLHPLLEEVQGEAKAQKAAADRTIQGDATHPSIPQKKEKELFEQGIRAELM